jgi:hypothetical protein
MRFLLRKQLNQHQDTGGDTLDSPGATNVVTVNTEDIDTPAVTATGDVTNPGATQPPSLSSSDQQASTQQLEEKRDVQTEQQQENTEDFADHTEVYTAALEQLGYDIDVTQIPEGIEGVVEFAKQIAQRERDAAIEAEYNDLRTNAAPAVELAQWLQSGRSETEFYLSRMQSPRIEPDTLDTAAPALVEDILYKNFIKNGFNEEMARTFTRNAIDSNTAVAAAKQIVAADNTKADQAKAEAEANAAVERENNYKAFVADIQAREEHIKKGQLKGITVPVTEQDAFINANFYDAGDPEYPNMSAVDIAMAKMTKEEVDLYRYLVWKKLDVSSLVQARAKTANVTAALLGKKPGASRMSGSANRTSGGDDDRTLDSPNA